MELPDPFQSEPVRAPQRKARGWIVPLIIVVGIAVFILSRRLRSEAPESVPPPPPPPAAAPAEMVSAPESAEPEVRYSIEMVAAETESTEPLPALDDSDGAIAAALARIVDKAALARFLIMSDCIRHVVATVDNLTSPTAPVRLWPVQPVGGRYQTSGAGQGIRSSPDNSRRYEPVLAFMESLDTAKLVALYVQHYPLFQEAYRELGYPDGDFNTRLVKVIDHLLAAPEIAEPVALVPHALMFKYADPKLEALSAGQKLLIRMGNANAQRVKAKLREVRQRLTREG